MITKIYHKKNELFNIEFFKNEGCTDPFEFLNEKSLYIQLKEGDISPFLEIYKYSQYRDIYLPYFPNIGTLDYLPSLENIYTLDNITVNLSKYIPEDNTVLFLNEDDANRYADECEAWFLYQENLPKRELSSQMDIRDYKKITIFIESYTKSEIKKTINIAKELKEKYGIEEVNLFILHCFVDLRPCYLPQISYLNDVLTYHFFNVLTYSKQERILAWEENGEELKNDFYFGYINTITTTNSTKIACIQEDSYYEHMSKLKNKLNILDCYDIFNDYLQNKNE